MKARPCENEALNKACHQARADCSDYEGNLVSITIIYTLVVLHSLPFSDYEHFADKFMETMETANRLGGSESCDTENKTFWHKNKDLLIRNNILPANFVIPEADGTMKKQLKFVDSLLLVATGITLFNSTEYDTEYIRQIIEDVVLTLQDIRNGKLTLNEVCNACNVGLWKDPEADFAAFGLMDNSPMYQLQNKPYSVKFPEIERWHIEIKPNGASQFKDKAFNTKARKRWRYYQRKYGQPKATSEETDEICFEEDACDEVCFV